MAAGPVRVAAAAISMLAAGWGRINCGFWFWVGMAGDVGKLGEGGERGRGGMERAMRNGALADVAVGGIP